MTEPPERRTQMIEAAAAAALLLWRILARTPHPLYRDWVAILAVYWILTLFTQKTRIWPWVTAGTMVLLALIFLQGQLPHTLSTLGLGL